MSKPLKTDVSQAPSAETQQVEISSIMAQVNEANQQREQNALIVGGVLLALAAVCAWFVAGKFLRSGWGAKKAMMVGAAVPFLLLVILLVGIGIGTGREITSLFVSEAGNVNFRALGLFCVVLITGVIFARLRLALHNSNHAKFAVRNAEEFK
ncbi:MAG: hypothetical protein ABJN35_10450 [Erythrobacter sp.]